ncbi:MAG: anaerobic ribonucleoside-triphosphate reductase activating protein [Clostridia bacterium]|nr:anaerobic ribonucleoside-triphosphate reductase activating protein [Clostridia bacterium]
MLIHGLQKMTLLDFPGRVACTVFLGGCDYRCPFCHNYELVDGTLPPAMDDDALFTFLQKRTGLLDGVAITGGEPCLHPDLPQLIRRIHDMGFAVKLDTNGAHPDMLRTLIGEGLVEYVAMDIKNSPDKYAMTVGLSSVDLAPVRESVRILLDGAVDCEFRTTVVDELHEVCDFEAIGAWIAGAKKYFLQVFSDRDTVPYGNLHAPSREKLDECLRIARLTIPQSALRGVD